MEREFDFKVVNMLKRSASQQGYLETVKKDQYGNVLSGRHRKKADPKWAEETVPVKDDLDRELKIIHYNVQRKPSMEETQRRLLRVAEILESRGVPTAEVLPQIVKLVPYTDRWIRQLLPDKYKHTEMRRGQKNILNELTGGEWLQFTKSWFVFDALKSDLEEERITSALSEQHPAPFSPTMVSDFIRFFTKRGEVVLDPFVGIGSTLVACSRTGRKGVGIDINEEYVEIAKKRVKEDADQNVICGNSWEIENLQLPYNPISYCITSPPYYRILEKANRKQRMRMEKSLDTNYSQPIPLPNTVDEYVKKLVELFSKIGRLTTEGGFLTVILQNFWDKNGMVPLAWQFTMAMIKSGNWTFKGERIWCQAHKKLLPYGQKFDFMPNVHHHYCLVFRK